MKDTSVVMVASVGPATVSHSATAIVLPIPHIPTPRWSLSKAHFGFTSYLSTEQHYLMKPSSPQVLPQEFFTFQ